MKTTFTDFGQLSNAILKKKLPPKPVEMKPEPKRSLDDGSDVLAYFSRPAQNAPKRPVSASGGGAADVRIAEMEAAVAAKDAALAALVEEKSAAEKQIRELQDQLQRERDAHESARRERDRLQGECARLSGELRKAAESRPTREPSEDAPIAQAVPPKPTQGLLAATRGAGEVFPGETREIVVSALRDALESAVHSGRDRRAEVLKSVLAANPATGELDRRRAELKQILKDAGYFNDPKPLERLGFKLVSGRTHWKLQYANVRVTMSKTPSDHRAYLNNSTEVANRCF